MGSRSGAAFRSWALRLPSPSPFPSRVASKTSFPTRRTFVTVSSSSTSTPSPNLHAAKKKQKVIVISGPTGSGKSRLAIELAKRLNGEIISADSVQVAASTHPLHLEKQTEMSAPLFQSGFSVCRFIGVLILGQRSLLRLKERFVCCFFVRYWTIKAFALLGVSPFTDVRHHLVDILHPSEDYSVGQFFEDARQATREIIENGRVPIVAGGTGLYLRWYIYGKPSIPIATPEIASEAYSELILLERNGNWDAAVQLLMKAGDPKAQFLPSNDWYRLRRSLEIIRSTGSPPSAFAVPYDSFKEQLDSRILDPSYNNAFTTGSLGENLSKDLDYDFICFFLSSRRSDLYKQIDLRCEEMLIGGKGILSEAVQLLEMGLYPNMNSATRAIGYRQAMEYLLRCRAQGGCAPEDFYAFLFEFQKASRLVVVL
ncbi:hypothetical protein ACLOJK_009377 [Asimina triloba]